MGGKLSNDQVTFDSMRDCSRCIKSGEVVPLCFGRSMPNQRTRVAWCPACYLMFWFPQDGGCLPSEVEQVQVEVDEKEVMPPG